MAKALQFYMLSDTANMAEIYTRLMTQSWKCDHYQDPSQLLDGVFTQETTSDLTPSTWPKGGPLS